MQSAHSLPAVGIALESQHGARVDRLRIHRQLAAVGLGLVAAAGGVATFGLALAGDSSAFAFTIPLMVLGIAGAALVARGVRFAFGFAALLGVAATALMVPYLLEVAGELRSFFDFVPAVMGTAGALLTVAAAAGGLSRRAAWFTSAGGRQAGYGIGGGAVALVLGLAVVSGIATIAGRETVAAADRVGATTFGMSAVRFETPEITARTGETVKLVVANDDPVLHTFTIEELGIDVVVRPGSEKLVTFAAPEPGTYTIICAISGHTRMKSVLTVE